MDARRALLLAACFSGLRLARAGQCLGVAEAEAPATWAARAGVSNVPAILTATAEDDVEDDLCRTQSRVFVQHLANFEEWALRMYDASAKIPSGLLNGNVVQLGDFDGCLGVDVRLRDRGKSGFDVVEDSVGGLAEAESSLMRIRGRYCLAYLDVELVRDTPGLRRVLKLAHSHNFARGTANESAHLLPRLSTLSWGVCVPAACSARQVERALRAAVTRFGRSGSWGSDVVRVHLAVPSNACHDLDLASPETPLAAHAASVAALLLGLTILAATLADTGPGESNGVLACFSLRRNWRTLTSPARTGGDRGIGCIDGVRTFFSLLIFVIHRGLAALWRPMVNRRQFIEDLFKLHFSPFRLPSLYVDAFLVVSGALAAYNLGAKLDPRVGGARLGVLGLLKTTLARLVDRVLRLTPSMAAVMIFYAFALERLGSGPQWGQIVDKNAQNCRDYMWRNLLYVQTLWPANDMCAPQTHQLSADVQLSLFAVPLVWLLTRTPALGAVAVLAIVGTSSWLRRRASLEHNISLFPFTQARMEDFARAADESYLRIPQRASAYVIGITLGYILYLAPKQMPLPRVTLVLGWTLSAVLAGWTFYGPARFTQLDYIFDVQDFVTLNTFVPVAFAISVSWLIFACQTGNAGWLDRVLSTRFMVTFSRISYAFYLTQFIPFIFTGGAARSSEEFNSSFWYNMVDLLTTVALSILLTLTVELPVQNLRSLFSSRARRKPNRGLANGGPEAKDNIHAADKKEE